MITNEMKAKIFGLYIGSEIQHNFGKVEKLKGVLNLHDSEGIEWFVKTDSHKPTQAGPIVSYKLILKPLSEITDEDLIEMSRIVGMTDEEISSMDNVNAETKVIWAKQMLVNGELTMEQSDFLRSKSYALPYMGIDLFESSLAIPKQ